MGCSLLSPFALDYQSDVPMRKDPKVSCLPGIFGFDIDPRGYPQTLKTYGFILWSLLISWEILVKRNNGLECVTFSPRLPSSKLESTYITEI